MAVPITNGSGPQPADVESQCQHPNDDEQQQQQQQYQQKQQENDSSSFKNTTKLSMLIATLFTANAPPRPPSKLKMAILTFLMIWAQVHFLGPAFASLPSLSTSPLAVEAVTIFTVVFSTEFVWMPLAMYVLSCWLFPVPRSDKDEQQRQDNTGKKDMNASRTTTLLEASSGSEESLN